MLPGKKTKNWPWKQNDKHRTYRYCQSNTDWIIAVYWFHLYKLIITYVLVVFTLNLFLALFAFDSLVIPVTWTVTSTKQERLFCFLVIKKKRKKKKKITCALFCTTLQISSKSHSSFIYNQWNLNVREPMPFSHKLLEGVQIAWHCVVCVWNSNTATFLLCMFLFFSFFFTLKNAIKFL